MAKGPAGIYSATYSGVPVYEFQFGVDLKEHVMRRRHDDWINATHILKAAGFDKPARTRILEREVQKDVHEKIQGGYGKYQGTWIPLESGEALAHRNNIYDRLRPIFEYTPGAESPPPAPRHTSKPKAPRAPKPAVPTWSSKSSAAAAARAQPHQRQPSYLQSHKVAPVHEEYEPAESHMGEDDTPDNLTVASASYMAEDDRYDMSHFSTGHRKRKREDMIQDQKEQQHAMYGDELLDYFVLSKTEARIRPDPPTNFEPNWPIDIERHTALHWAAAMGDVEVVKQLRRFNASVDAQNVRGETPFMRAVNFTNCYEKQTFPTVMKELFSTIEARDLSGCTVIHHAATMKSGRVNSPSCSRYYLDNILTKLQETLHPEPLQQLLDAQDNEGNTAVHLAAQIGARKSIRSLLGRGASTDIPNHAGVRAEDMIRELNAAKSKVPRPLPARSSSPFAPDTQRRTDHFRDALGGDLIPIPVTSQLAFAAESAKTVQSRIAPLVLSKIQDLAASYDEEFREHDEAEKQARTALTTTEAELVQLRATLAELEPRLEADEAVTKIDADAVDASTRLLTYISHQNRMLVQEAEEAALAEVLNGDTTTDASKEGETEAAEPDDFDERLRLANELHEILLEQRLAEKEYVEARGMVGTGETIDKYRHLLRSCLPPEDQENLDANLDDLIKMMEEEAEEAEQNYQGVESVEDLGLVTAGAGMSMMVVGEPMEITGV